MPVCFYESLLQEKDLVLTLFCSVIGFSFNLSQFFKTNASALLKSNQHQYYLSELTEVLLVTPEELEQDPF